MYGVRPKEQEKVYTDLFQKGSKSLYFAACRDENETWVPLLEKAFAKAHGDYAALGGGQVGYVGGLRCSASRLTREQRGTRRSDWRCDDRNLYNKHPQQRHILE